MKNLGELYGRFEVDRFSCLNEENRDYFDRIQKATIRMRDLIEDLLKYSRLGTQAIPFELVSVERHKGTITAKSEPGKGTTFIIRIPPRY